MLAVIVPTIALIDETRRRLFSRFGNRYKIVTHVGQQPAERTIYVLTPERVPEMLGIGDVTFFAIDEFYKLDPRVEPDRSEAMNEALYRLHTNNAQFYLLGPNVGELPRAFTLGYDCHFERTDFATVATEVERVSVPPEERPERLAHLVAERTALGEATLVYCRSPESARRVARLLAQALEARARPALNDAVDWVSRHYHPEWGFVAAISHGIGLHHGPMPRALQQFVTRAFNDGRLDVLVCTSTLIEGVNTTAKNVIIYDHSIGTRPLDYFTYQNIKGRSGRMGRHFVGRVYIFAEPPQPSELPVDIPVATQSSNAPDSLLIQMAEADLSDEARERIRPYFEQTLIPIFVLRENHGIDPAAQLRLAAHIRDNADEFWPLLRWRTPTRRTRSWRQFVISVGFSGARRSASSRGAKRRSTFFPCPGFSAVTEIRSLIEAELESQTERTGERDPDGAVEDTLDFLRNWANYHFPRYLMAVSRIQEVIFGDTDLPPGDYSAFARTSRELLPSPGYFRPGRVRNPAPSWMEAGGCFGRSGRSGRKPRGASSSGCQRARSASVRARDGARCPSLLVSLAGITWENLWVPGLRFRTPTWRSWTNQLGSAGRSGQDSTSSWSACSVEGHPALTPPLFRPGARTYVK